jgi:hypothetical protein
MKDLGGRASRAKEGVIRLQDLAPRQDVVGGKGKLVFGEGVGEEQVAREHEPGQEPRATRGSKGRR